MNELTHDLNDRTPVHAYFKDFSSRVTITAAPRNRSPEIGAPYLNAQDVVTGVFSGCPRRQSLQSVLSFRGCHILLNSPACFSGMPGGNEDTCLRLPRWPLPCCCIAAVVRLTVDGTWCTWCIRLCVDCVLQIH